MTTTWFVAIANASGNQVIDSDLNSTARRKDTRTAECESADSALALQVLEPCRDGERLALFKITRTPVSRMWGSDGTEWRLTFERWVVPT